MYRYRNNCPCNKQNQVTNNSNEQNSASSDNPKCQCGFADDGNSVFPTNFMFGQSYVPIQTMDTTFKPEVYDFPCGGGDSAALDDNGSRVQILASKRAHEGRARQDGASATRLLHRNLSPTAHTADTN